MACDYEDYIGFLVKIVQLISKLCIACEMVQHCFSWDLKRYGKHTREKFPQTPKLLHKNAKNTSPLIKNLGRFK